MRLAPSAAAALAVILTAACATSSGHHPVGARTRTTPSPAVSTHRDLSEVAPPPAKPSRNPHRASPMASGPGPSSPTVSPSVANGLTVVLNPGHNGDDYAHPDEVNRLVPSGYGNEKACDTTGTNTTAGYPEHAFNWDVASRVRRILTSAGVQVIMTRNSDSGVGPCVNQRAAIGNRPGVDAVVSIHADGAPVSGHGFHVNQDSRRPDGATAAVAHESIELGRAIHATLARSSGLVPSTYIGTNGYYYRDDLAGLNLARRPTTFLELGNMKNPGDAALQSSPAGRQRIAAAVAAGILAFLGR